MRKSFAQDHFERCLPETLPVDAAVAAELFYDIVHNPAVALSYMTSPLCMAIGVLYHEPALLQLPIPPTHTAPSVRRLPAGFRWTACEEYAPWREPADEEHAWSGRWLIPQPTHMDAQLWRVEHNEYAYLHLPWDWEDGRRCVGRHFKHTFYPGAQKALQTYCHEIHIWVGVIHPWKIVVRRDLPARIEVAMLFEGRELPRKLVQESFAVPAACAPESSEVISTPRQGMSRRAAQKARRRTQGSDRVEQPAVVR
jgi:hypothetical protein